jgi:hypothetical protein
MESRHDKLFSISRRINSELYKPNKTDKNKNMKMFNISTEELVILIFLLFKESITYLR